MRPAGALAAWLMAVLLLAGTSAAGNAQAQSKPPSVDAAITAGVHRALARDASLSAMDIKVETQGAVVKLTGFVRSVGDIDKAGTLARKVPGVAGVSNGLRVANPPSRA